MHQSAMNPQEELSLPLIAIGLLQAPDSRVFCPARRACGCGGSGWSWQVLPPSGHPWQHESGKNLIIFVCEYRLIVDLHSLSQVQGAGHAAGVMSYVPQVAWCQNSSLRDNIVFGERFDQERYNTVIHACALELGNSALPSSQGSRAQVPELLEP